MLLRMTSAGQPSMRSAQQRLRDVGLRVTRPRAAVLDILADHPHTSADEVLRLVRAELPAVSHQAVYDVLRALSTAALVRRIEPAGSVARYEIRVGDNHHHLVCRGCGAIVDVNCATGAAPCLTATDDHGFAVDEAEIVYWGRCPACSAVAVPSRTDPPDTVVRQEPVVPQEPATPNRPAAPSQQRGTP